MPFFGKIFNKTREWPVNNNWQLNHFNLFKMMQVNFDPIFVEIKKVILKDQLTKMHIL